MPTALVVGHVCVDLTPHLPGAPSFVPGDLVAVGPLRVTPGGCVANTGGDLAELGIAVRVSADIGDDELSGPLRALLAARGLDVAGFRTTAATTSYSIVLQPPGADRTFWHHTGANTQFDGVHVELDGADLLHVGYPPLLPALVADGGAPLLSLLSRAHHAGVVTSLDLAVVDSPTAASRAFWRDVLVAVIPLVDIVTPSLDDLESALGAEMFGGSAVDAARLLVELGAGIAVVSNGTEGFAMATASRPRFAAGGRLLAGLDAAWHGLALTLPAAPVPSTVTTTGAGDAATAGLLAAVLRGVAPEQALQHAADVAAARVAGRPLAVR